MTVTVVVLGAGYAGTAAVRRLEDELADADAEVVWVSDAGHHLVRHESHRVISDPNASEALRIPIERIKSSETRFVRGEVVSLDVERREIALAGGSTVAYDYALVALGSRTAYFGVDGLATHALTLETAADALRIRDAVVDAARGATDVDPARVVVVGGGLTGVQSAGEIAELRAARDLPAAVTLVEASDRLAAGLGSELSARLREELDVRGVEVRTGARVDGVDASTIRFDGGGATDYDVLLWAGGVAGPAALTDADLDHVRGRLVAAPTFETSDERVFAVGDAAHIAPEDAADVPPTAEAAKEGGTIAGGNVARAVRGESLRSWSYADDGLLVSVGSATVAHGVARSPVSTFGGWPARLLKKLVAARWVGRVASWRAAARLWPDA